MNTDAWERTEKIGNTLENVLTDSAISVRMVALKRMRREKIPIRLAILSGWLHEEKDTNRVKTILDSLDAFGADDLRSLLERIVLDKTHAQSNRQVALTLFVRGLPEASAKRLLTLALSIEDSPVLAKAIRELGRYKAIDSDRFLHAKLKSLVAVVRAAAIEVLAERGVAAAGKSALTLLSDVDVRVRRAAAFAVGKLVDWVKPTM